MLSYKTGAVLQIRFPFTMLICSETLMKPYKCFFVLSFLLCKSTLRYAYFAEVLQGFSPFEKKIRSRTYIITNLKTFFYITSPQLVLLLLLQRCSVFTSSTGHVETAQGTSSSTFSSSPIWLSSLWNPDTLSNTIE